MNASTLLEDPSPHHRKPKPQINIETKPPPSAREPQRWQVLFTKEPPPSPGPKPTRTP